MSRNLRVLVVEDSAEDAELLLDALRASGFEPTADRVQSQEEMRAALDAGEWDLVLSDHSLPQFDAPGALRVVKEHDLDVPFIIVSGTISEADAVAAMCEGAHDYLLKDNLVRLGAAVERELGESASRRRRRAAEERIAYLAHYDGPTGLPNRLFIQERADESMQTRPASPITLVAIGVERLHEVREAFGYRSGDALVREVAQRLEQVVEHESVARIGEDRLAVLLEGEASDLPAARAQDMLKACQSLFVVNGPASRHLGSRWPGGLSRRCRRRRVLAQCGRLRPAAGSTRRARDCAVLSSARG